MPLDLKKKAGPLSRGAWIGVGVGTVAAWYLIRRYESDKSASALNQASALLGGSTVPTDSDGSVTSTPASFATLGLWEQAAIAAMESPGYSNAQALNDINAWLSGSCVSAAGYTAISSILGNNSIGLPPGYSTLPAIQVCSQSTPPPATPAPTTTAPTASTVANDLAKLDAAAFPKQYNFGSYTFSAGGPGTQFTQVGVINNGVYQGSDVLNGAPVYAEAFGALVQDFNAKSLPNGTGVYVPTYLVNEGYVDQAVQQG